jgi:hypothetical protein
MCSCRSVTFTDKATSSDDMSHMYAQEVMKSKSLIMKGIKSKIMEQYADQREDNFGDSDAEDDSKLPLIPKAKGRLSYGN